MVIISKAGLVSAAVVIFLASSSTFAKPTRENPMVEKVIGAQKVTVIKAKNTKELPAGADLEYGDRLKTGEKMVVTVLFPDDSRLIVVGNSDVEIEPKVDNAQWNRLRAGQVHGII